MSQPPKVSIIIATFNADKYLNDCLDSITRQSLADYELIVIDGGSTDSTVAILEARKQEIAAWRSEPDRGIYDAWNKGLAHARGDWICFLGADDVYAHPNALRNLLTAAQGSDLVFGRIQYLDAAREPAGVAGAPWSWREMLNRQVVAHPGSLHHRRLFEEFGRFDASLRIAGDYEFLLRVGEKARASYLDEVILLCGSEGVSRTQVQKVLLERRQIQSGCRHIGPWRASINYHTACIKASLKGLLVSCRRGLRSA